MNAVIYARYSSAKQNDESIEQQLQKAHKYAEEHHYNVIAEYCDRAVSGRTDNREQFQKMLHDAKKKKFQVVITWKVDRFGRNRLQLELNKHELKKHGVSVEYVAESIPEGNEGILLESILEGMAEYYSRQLSTNVKRGMLYNAQQGKATGPAPFGYKINEDKRIIIDEETAPAIRLIFSRYASGIGVVDICNELNALGFKSPHGLKFNRSSLHRILSNEKYIGRYVYKRGTPEEQILEDCIPPLVDMPTFLKCQNIFIKHKRGKRTEESKDMYILSGKLFCGKCGNSMQGMSGNGRHGTVGRYYRCYGRAKHTCDKKNVRCETIETAVINTILELFKDKDLVNTIADKLMEIYNAQNQHDIELLNKMQKELNSIPSKIDKLFDLMLENNLPKEDITNKINALKDRQNSLKNDITAMTPSFPLNKNIILEYFHNLRITGCQTNSEKRNLINSFIKRIFLYDDRILLEFNFLNDSEPVPLPEESELNDSVVTMKNRVTICLCYKPIRMFAVLNL